MKTESGILFCNLWVNTSGSESVMQWDLCKFGITLDEVISFWESDKEGSTKIVTYDGDLYTIDVSFDKFSEIIIKHRNSITIFN